METLTNLADLNEFAKSISPNKCLFYEDVKQFTKVYFVNAVAVRIRQSFSSPKFPEAIPKGGVSIVWNIWIGMMEWSNGTIAITLSESFYIT